MTNFEKIKNMSVEELADLLKSLAEGENKYEVGCFTCVYYGTHHSDIKNKGTYLYECADCDCESIGLDLVKWLESEVKE